MIRLACVSIAVALVACGSKTSSTADAPVIMLPDAPPPPDATVDALVCTAPQMMCTAGSCTDTNADEQNCGTCDNACKGGQYCSPQPDGCKCPSPANFLPDNLPTNPGDMIQELSQFGINFGVGPAGGTNGLNGLVVVYSTDSTQENHDYTLSPPQGGIPSIPTLAALYGININTQSADATYLATSGTVKFTTVCNNGASGHEIAGTLTDVKFEGAVGDIMAGQFQIDPDGCSFTVPSMTFDIKMGTCP